MTLKNKKILLIIGGGIAAYKSLDLIRLLKKNHVEVRTILTKSGKEFVTPLSLSTLTKSKTFENIFDSESEAEIDHIALSRWADIILVMPTTANFMSKLTLGKAEDLATTVLLAADKDIVLVPAMNVRMWLHKATQSNLKILQDFGYLFLGPEKGEMACGEFGEGKMSSPRQIFVYLKNYFDKKNIVKERNLKALVTAGPTREYIDPIRYISNESSGKQGYEIAIALNKLGINTTLITGPSKLVSPKGVKVKKIISADEMLSEVKKTLPVDLAVCTAAVVDFKPLDALPTNLESEYPSLSIYMNQGKIAIVDEYDIADIRNSYQAKMSGFRKKLESNRDEALDKMLVKGSVDDFLDPRNPKCYLQTSAKSSASNSFPSFCHCFLRMKSISSRESGG